MAKDNGDDKNKKTEIKNPELLNPNKDTQQERLDRGRQGIPQGGQTWAEKKSSEEKGVIKKPDLFHEAMKTKGADKQNDKVKQIDKDINNDKDKS